MKADNDLNKLSKDYIFLEYISQREPWYRVLRRRPSSWISFLGVN